MPRIQEYNVQTSVGNAPEVRLARPNSAVGEGLQSLANVGLEISDKLKKAQEQSDISDIHVSLAQAQADWTNEYQKQLQEGTLDSEDFNSKFNTAMEKAAEDVTTRAGRLYFNQASAQLKAHFLETAAIGQAELKGAKAKENYNKSLQMNSSTLLNDPSSFGLVNSLQQQSIQTLTTNGTLPAKAAGELSLHSQTELAKSAVRGWINLNPEDAKAQLNQGKWDEYIGGELKHQLIGEAEQAANARLVEDNRLKKQQQEVLKQQQTETQNQFLEKLSKNTLSAKEVLSSNLDPFGTGSKEQFIKLIAENDKTKGEVRTDSNTKMNLWNRIHLPDGDPNKLLNENELNAYFGKGLTYPDIKELRDEIQGRHTQEGRDESDLKQNVIREAQDAIVKRDQLTGVADPIATNQYNRWFSNFIKNYNEQRQKGVSPYKLLTPGTPEYLGSDIRTYIRDRRSVMRDLVKVKKAAVPIATPTPAATPEPRKPGESAAAYLQRVGK